MDKKSFVLYTDWTPYFSDLTVEESGILIQAIFAWANGNEYEIESPILKAIFSTIKMRLEEDAKSYEEKVQARKEAGARGGLAKASKTKQTLAKPSKAKQNLAKASKAKHNDNDNDNDNDNECSNEHINSSEAALGAGAREESKQVRLEEALKDYADMRKLIKKPLTKRAMTLERNKLEQLAPGDIEKQIRILEQSVTHSWQGLYPLKADSGGAKDTDIDAIMADIARREKEEEQRIERRGISEGTAVS